MSTQAPASNDDLAATVRTPDDAALRIAWERFLEFDRASIRQKQIHSWLRLPIIALIILSSVFAVAISYKENYEEIADISSALRVLVIIAPLAATAFMMIAYQFSPSLSWIAYRIGAELVRKQIYLYRMNAEPYAGLSPRDQQRLLNAKVKEANQEIAKIGATVPNIGEPPDNLLEVIKTKITDTQMDDGFRPMTGAEYANWRVKHQLQWYISRVRKDYGNLWRWRVLVVGTTAVGSVLAALGAEPLVAITATLSVTLGMLIDLKMYGRTYSIYHMTKDRLRNELADWLILSPAERADPAVAADFVKRTEQIFQDERDSWMKQAIESQMANEQALMKQLGIDAEDGEP